MILKTAVGIIAGLLSIGSIGSDTLKFSVANGSGEVGSTAKTDLLVEPASGLGAFQLNVAYDPKLIKPDSVEPGDGVNALIEFNIMAPGLLRIAFASSSAGTGEGAIARILWTVKEEGVCTLEVSDIRAWENSTSFELPVTSVNSEFKAIAPMESVNDSSETDSADGNGNIFSSPVFIGLVLGCVIVVLLLILVLRKRA